MGERGIDVHKFHQCLSFPARGLGARRADNERRTRSVFEVAVLAPQAVVTQVPAVVTPQANDRTIAEPQPIQLVQQSPDLSVDIADAGVVSVDQPAGFLIAHGTLSGDVAVVPQLAETVHRQCRSPFGPEGVAGQFDLLWIVQAPVLLRCDEGQVRLDEAHCQKERLILLVQVLQRLHRMAGQLAIVGQVVGNLGRFGGQAAGEVVHPFVQGFVALTGDPFEVLSSCRDPFRSVVVSRSAEPRRYTPRLRIMHVATTVVGRRLPREGTMEELAHPLRVIAVVLEVLRQRDSVGDPLAKMRPIAPDTGRVRSQSRQQAGTRRPANGLLTVGPQKDGSALRQPIDVWTLDVIPAVTAQLGPQVVDGNEKDVGPGRLVGIGRHGPWRR